MDQIPLTLRDFDNRLRSLFNIDFFRLREMSDSQWVGFVNNPVEFWLRTDDATRAIIWREIEARQDRKRLEEEDPIRFTLTEKGIQL